MIYKITKKEFASLKRHQENGFHTCLLFKTFDGLEYKCDTMGATGLKEIRRFQLAQKKLADDRERLQGLQSVLL